MKNLKIYLIELILFISIIVFNIFYQNTTYLYISIIILTVVSFLLFGFHKDNSYIKGNVNRIIIAGLLSFFIVTYAIGLFVGFNKTPFLLTYSYILKVILFEFLVIFCEEILRYIIAKKSFDSKIPIIIFTIIMCVLNIIIEINGKNFSDREMVFIFTSVIIIPVISREVLCSYLTYNVSYIPSLLFKSIIILYEFVLPIIPNLGNYLYSVFNLILVYCIFYFSNRIIMYAEKSNKYSRKVTKGIIYIPILAILLVIVVLVSGFLKYKMIAVGSNSMLPTYEKGDAIVYEKVNVDDLKIGDIIAFKQSDVVITHRIVSIRKNNTYVFKTKGDNNNAIDYFDVQGYNVLGKVIYKVKYIGYPTIWINDFFKRGEMNYDQ